MLELYNDKLIDLFAKPGLSDDVSIGRFSPLISFKTVINI